MSSISSAMRHVTLPELNEELLCSTSGTQMVWNESRRFRRSPCNALGSLQSRPTFATAGYDPVSQDVLLRDISRGGVRFIHGWQLFPGESCILTLSSGKQMHLEVVWCRCMQGSVFVTGCQFVAEADSETMVP